jgi:hypothetical protein
LDYQVVIARLDRAIQYSQRVSERPRAGYWMPAFAGMTVQGGHFGQTLAPEVQAYFTTTPVKQIE